MLQFEPLEGKALLSTLPHVVHGHAQVATPDASLRQLAFLVGTWDAQLKFPNGAAAPQRQVLRYRMGHHRILLNEAVIRPRIFVRGVIRAEAGRIVETGQDSAGQSVIQTWTPTVPGSFVITGTNQGPAGTLQVRTTLTRFSPNSIIFAREIISADGSSQVEAIARLHRIR
jgi:hypothetical protein